MLPQMNKRKSKRLVVGLVTLGVLFFGYYKLVEFFRVDSCLDRGGSWNYEIGVCEFNKAVESVPH